MQPAQLPPSERHLSVDVLRGVVMWTMLFVNDIGSVESAPRWMKHFHPDLGNGMTFVDVVFPAFLFVVGLSIPLALSRRQAKGESLAGTLIHIAWRTSSLLLMGVFMVNMHDFSPWTTLSLLGLILAFLSIESLPKSINLALRILGFTALAALYFYYPHFYPGKAMSHEWWGILGLIGWAYLVGCLAYLFTRGNQTALTATAALLIALFFAAAQSQFATLSSLPVLHMLSAHLDLGSMIGTHGAITVLGVLLATVLTSPHSHRQRLTFAATLTLTAFLAGLLTYPSFGTNKNIATPSWALFSAAITAALWTLTYTLTNILPLSRTPPARFFAAAGGAALLIYLSQSLWFRLFSHLNVPYDALAPSYPAGLLRASAAATLLTTLAILLAKHRMRIKV